MAKRIKKVVQPPVDLQRRHSESRPMIVGALAAILGGAMIFAGLMSLHQLGGKTVEATPEWKLVELVTHAGVRLAEPAAPVPGHPTALAASQPARTPPPAAVQPTIKKVEKPPAACPT